MRAVTEDRMKLAEFQRSVWHVTAAAGTTLDDVCQPAWYANLAHKLRPSDRVEIEAEDGSFFAEMIVRQSSRAAAVVQELRSVTFGEGVPDGETALDDYTVGYAGPHHKWRVVRTADRAVISHGHGDKATALKVAAQLAREMA
jgi:hypothetical protein